MGIPNDLRVKFYESKLFYHQSLNQMEKVNESLKLALEALEASGLKGPRLKAKKEQLTKLSKAESKSNEDSQSYDLNPIPKLSKPHERYPSFSD